MFKNDRFLSIPMITINIFEKVKLTNPTLLIGFQGVGLVGSLAAGYLTDKMSFKQIGYIETPALVPMAMVLNSEIRFPLRVFADKANNMFLIESELPIPHKQIFNIADAISDWAKQMGVKRVVCMEGIGTGKAPKDGKVFGIGNSKIEDAFLKKNNVELLKNGIIVGLAAAVLLKCKAKKIPAICLMSEAHSQYPDGRAAAKVIDTLSSLYNWKIDTKQLIEKSNQMEKKIKTMIKKVKNIEETPLKPEHLYG